MWDSAEAISIRALAAEVIETLDPSLRVEIAGQPIGSHAAVAVRSRREAGRG